MANLFVNRPSGNAAKLTLRETLPGGGHSSGIATSAEPPRVAAFTAATTLSTYRCKTGHWPFPSTRIEIFRPVRFC